MVQKVWPMIMLPKVDNNQLYKNFCHQTKDTISATQIGMLSGKWREEDIVTRVSCYMKKLNQTATRFSDDELLFVR